MASGQNASTRIMIAGSEDLGNNTKVSFRLENGFNSDTGEFGDADRLFNREASLSLHTQYGTVSFGRMGGVLLQPVRMTWCMQQLKPLTAVTTMSLVLIIPTAMTTW